MAEYAGPLVYDDYVGTFRAADPLSLDPLDLEAVAAWEEEHGARLGPDLEEEQATPAPAPRPPREAASEHPRCRLCRRVRRRYAESSDGLLRVCLDCAQGLPLAQLTAWKAVTELIVLRRPAQRHDFIERLRARFPDVPVEAGIVQDGRRRRKRGPAGPAQGASSRSDAAAGLAVATVE